MNETDKSAAIDALLAGAIYSARVEAGFCGQNVHYGPRGGRREVVSPSDCEADKIRATVRRLVLDRLLPMPSKIRLVMYWYFARLYYETAVLEQVDHDGNWRLGSLDGQEIALTRLETTAELAAIIELIANPQPK